MLNDDPVTQIERTLRQIEHTLDGPLSNELRQSLSNRHAQFTAALVALKHEFELRAALGEPHDQG